MKSPIHISFIFLEIFSLVLSTGILGLKNGKARNDITSCYFNLKIFVENVGCQAWILLRVLAEINFIGNRDIELKILFGTREAERKAPVRGKK
jgi:hypothetical protein